MEELCANLPEETVITDLPEAEKVTSDGRLLKCIGTDLIRSELIKEPARVYVRKYYCKSYVDPKAETETGKADIRRPEAPAPLLPHSYASASVVTDIIVKKYADALPLYRQEQIWKRMGVDLKRNTMANWVIQTAELYLKPLVLGDYRGVVISDGYSGYGVLSESTRAGCWAHARRKWVEAMPTGATKENALAAKGLEYCSRLFEIEQKLEGLSDEERLEQRQLLSKPIVDEYYTWLQAIFKPAGKLKKAITYSLNQREYLCAFLEHGEIEISNNQVENAIRPIVVGRKNWLFCDTQAGANASVIIFTMLETAKANGLNPEAWLHHILSVLPDRFTQNPDTEIDDLLPWTDVMQQQFGL